MSILHSTKSGYRYKKWQDDLDQFAERSLKLSEGFTNVWMEVRFTVPKYLKTIEDWGEEEQWFKFNSSWSKEEFKKSFCKTVEQIFEGTHFEKEDARIPNTHIIE